LGAGTCGAFFGCGGCSSLAFAFLRGVRAVAAKDNVVQEGRGKTCRKE